MSAAYKPAQPASPKARAGCPSTIWLPDQTWNDRTAYVSKGSTKADWRRGTVCPRWPNTHALRSQDSLPQTQRSSEGNARAPCQPMACGPASAARPLARAGRTAARWGAAVALGPQSCGHQSTVAIAAFDVIVRVVPLLPGLVIGGNPVSAERL